MPKILNFRVIIEQDEDGLFIAEVPALPGCYTQGKSYEEALLRVKEVIELCLEEAKNNASYRSKIDLSEEPQSKFLGITNVPVRVTF